MDMTTGPNGSFVAIASTDADRRELWRAVFDTPMKRRRTLRDWQWTLAGHRKRIAQVRDLRRLTGDKWDDIWRGPEQYARSRWLLLADLRRARRKLRAAEAAVAAIATDFPGRV